LTKMMRKIMWKVRQEEINLTAIFYQIKRNRMMPRNNKTKMNNNKNKVEQKNEKAPNYNPKNQSKNSKSPNLRSKMSTNSSTNSIPRSSYWLKQLTLNTSI
jgi:hypothetical protein